MVKEVNDYGFKQTRIAQEGESLKYGRVTKYISIDCEMDMNTEDMT